MVVGAWVGEVAAAVGVVVRAAVEVVQGAVEEVPVEVEEVPVEVVVVQGVEAEAVLEVVVLPRAHSNHPVVRHSWCRWA